MWHRNFPSWQLHLDRFTPIDLGFAFISTEKSKINSCWKTVWPEGRATANPDAIVDNNRRKNETYVKNEKSRGILFLVTLVPFRFWQAKLRCFPYPPSSPPPPSISMLRWLWRLTLIWCGFSFGTFKRIYSYTTLIYLLAMLTNPTVMYLHAGLHWSIRFNFGLNFRFYEMIGLF